MRIIVLMSTYNGEKYLSEQIESILHQEGVDIYLLIRDDGSKDHTVDIIDEFRKSHPNIGLLSGGNKGFIGSFSELIKYVYNHETSDCYYAFVDQDDVWYPNKLKTACERLDNYPNNIPNLFCSNSDIINGEGKRTGKQFRYFFPRYSRGNVLMFPLLQGCSMVFNRKAVELYAEHEPHVSYHDRWMYLICHFLGNVYYEHGPMFGYRIHGSNVVGTRSTKGFSEQCVRLWKMFFSRIDSEYFIMNDEFFAAYEKDLDRVDRRLFKQYLSYKNNWNSKVNLLFSGQFGPFHLTVRERLLYVVHVILNKL